MAALKRLLDTDPIGFYELVAKARDPRHAWFNDEIREKMQRLALVERSGGMHDITRAVILSAVTGEGLALELRSPIQDDEE